jgi:NAD(P)H-dependent FMN reductase
MHSTTRGRRYVFRNADINVSRLPMSEREPLPLARHRGPLRLRTQRELRAVLRSATTSRAASFRWRLDGLVVRWTVWNHRRTFRGRRHDARNAERRGPVVDPVTCRILLVPGSLRASSTNLALLRTAQALWPSGILFAGLGSLPLYNPDLDGPPLPAAAAALRAEIHQSTAILFCTPEYAGALPGVFKNLLDWTIGDEHPGSIYDKSVGWINARPHGAVHAHAELRRVLNYANANIIEAACAEIPVTPSMVGANGLITDPPTREAIRAVLTALNSCGDQVQPEPQTR